MYTSLVGVTEMIAEEERALAEALEQLLAARAKRDGILARLETLRAGIGDDSPFAALDQTEAIVSVLRDAGVPLRIPQIVDRLQAGGRPDDNARSVSATLSYLRRAGRIAQPIPRGPYESV